MCWNTYQSDPLNTNRLLASKLTFGTFAMIFISQVGIGRMMEVSWCFVMPSSRMTRIKHQVCPTSNGALEKCTKAWNFQRSMGLNFFSYWLLYHWSHLTYGERKTQQGQRFQRTKADTHRQSKVFARHRFLLLFLSLYKLQMDATGPQTLLLVVWAIFKKERNQRQAEPMVWLAQSPDLIVVELGWGELDKKVKAKQHVMSNVERMPRICPAVVTTRGGYMDGSKIWPILLLIKILKQWMWIQYLLAKNSECLELCFVLFFW